MGQAFTPPSRDFLRELQVLRREVDALKRMPSGAASISTGYLAPVPACRVYRDAAVSIVDTVATALQYNQDEYDVWGMHDTVTNRHRLTAPIAGLYVVGAFTGFAANAGGTYRELFLQKNLDATWGDFRHAETMGIISATIQARMSVNTVVRLNAGDWMSVVVRQNSGGNLLTENITQVRDEAWMCWLGN